MTGASPRAILSEESAKSAAGMLNIVLETLWDPGRVVVFTELSAFCEASPNGLSCSVLFGLLGAAGHTAIEAGSVRDIVGALVARHGFPYALESINPLEVLLLRPRDLNHTALIRQRTVTAEVGEERIEVLSRWNPTFDPWGPISRLLLARGLPTRVRATVLATDLSLDDRATLERSIDQVHWLTESVPTNPDGRFQLERATSTLVDIKASFGSPLFAAEVAVASPFPLPDPILRSIGCSITSQTDTLRQPGLTIVAGQRFILGGFDVDRDPPGLPSALRQGLPLYGGVGPRGLRDVVSLRENPLGFPVPANGPVPTISTLVTRPRPVPQELREGEFVGVDHRGEDIRIPRVEAGRHSIVLGESGSGKSTVLTAGAILSLRERRPFFFLDPHGMACDRICAVAAAEGISLDFLDASDGGTRVLSPFPALRRDQRNLSAVTLAIGRFCDSLAATLPEGWAGPRWRQHTMALGFLSAAHKVPLAQALDWYADDSTRRAAMEHPGLPDSARRTLHLLNTSTSGNAAETIDWVIAKLDPIVTGPAASLLAAPGKGIDIARHTSEGKSLAVNLAGLGSTDGALIGHLILSGVLDAAIGQTDPRHFYHVYLDEAPRYKAAAKSIERIMGEGRKFSVSLSLAAQSLNQFTSPSMRDAVTSASVKMAFRQSPDAAQQLADMFDVMPHELSQQPDLHAFLKVGVYPATTVRVPPYEEVQERAKEPRSFRSRRRRPPMVKAPKDKPRPVVQDQVGWLDAWLQRQSRDDAIGDDIGLDTDDDTPEISEEVGGKATSGVQPSLFPDERRADLPT
jgi:energy-coupling factor transporter ATP-binding protein EcfA2